MIKNNNNNRIAGSQPLHRSPRGRYGTLHRSLAAIMATAVSFFVTNLLYAAQVETRLSGREAYVGSPIVLQIEIVNAQDYDLPTTPSIDGCDVRSAGPPTQKSSISIINGRRSEKRSVTLRYLITPQREGTFEIPSITIKADGQDLHTRPLQFVATKSENGDVLFVEVEGNRDKVFVGQPLDLTLKIYVRPYRDQQQRITLSEGDMWQLISEQSSWGVFADRIRELEENRQRPRGVEVLRDDGQGNQRSYYLYEIDATIYPTKPGKIIGDEIRIILNYPTAVRRARDPFESIFGNDPFDRDSLLSQMMDDDFFQSPFRNRLQIANYRPVIAYASVDTTQIVPVPTQGRPADYRGAVGRYQIVTEADPTHVAAGDPITLNIGISGTGPMELVQAPPLAEIPSLTKDFQVDDRSLAGLVQGSTKVFSTTIRPRRAGIREIPAIPFSFFDPDSEQFVTVKSDPIPITVDEAESLALDAIVDGTNSNIPTSDTTATPFSVAPTRPRFGLRPIAQSITDRATEKPSPPSIFPWWTIAIWGPALIWCLWTVVRFIPWIGNRMPAIRTAQSSFQRSLKRANHADQVADALRAFIEMTTRRKCLEPVHAVGVLRSAGLYPLANAVEAFFDACHDARYSGHDEEFLTGLKRDANELAARIQRECKQIGKLHIRRNAASPSRDSLQGPSGAILRVGIAMCIGASLMSQHVYAFNADTPADASISSELNDSDALDATTLQSIAQEAEDIMREAQALEANESAQANSLYARAAEKLQYLVDHGITDPDVYFNLANAYLKSGQLGKAIANYRRVLFWDPTDRQAWVNLQYAQQQAGLVLDGSEATPDGSSSLSKFYRTFQQANRRLVGVLGLRPIIAIMILTSIAFWIVIFAKPLGWVRRRWPLAIPLGLCLGLTIGSYVSIVSGWHDPTTAIVVSENVTLRSGDDDQFSPVAELENAEGQPVHIVAQRGNWFRIRTPRGEEGWLKRDQVEPVLTTQSSSSDRSS